MLAPFPLDLSSFGELRRQNYLYVDKTSYAHRLITGGRRFFLSRPRRFGKTLFLSTLQEILLGQRELCNTLFINTTDYHWQPYGVITLDLSALGIDSPATLKSGLKQALCETAEYYQLTIDTKPAEPEIILRNLVKALRKQIGRVALLIDEYDSPILHSLKEPVTAQTIRNSLQRFFAAIKGLDTELDFVFITGVTNFARAGIFSGLNNLRIISLDNRFGAICGYTEAELQQYFSAYLQAWAKQASLDYPQLLDRIKVWYNGYRFGNDTLAVYNPFSLMHAIDQCSFENFWFQSGTPAFLVNELVKETRKAEYPLFGAETFKVSSDSLGVFDIGATPLAALMFQTGYLTITGYDAALEQCEMGYPNQEVKTTLQRYLLTNLAKLDFANADRLTTSLRVALEQQDLPAFIRVLKQLFNNLPYQIQVKKEQFYHAILHAICDAAGLSVQSEYSTSHGRIDLIISLPARYYVIEVKFNQPASRALEQIIARNYHEHLTKHDKPIVLLGLAFQRTPKVFDITYAEQTIPAA